jgi:hypothetical protein
MIDRRATVSESIDAMISRQNNPEPLNPEPLTPVWRLMGGVYKTNMLCNENKDVETALSLVIRQSANVKIRTRTGRAT